MTRTIYEILEDVQNLLNSQQIEMTEDLTAFLNLLSTFNDHVKPFRNLQIITDNERYLNELKHRIENFLKQRNYWDLKTNSPSRSSVHDQLLRKITLFLVFNTDTEGNYIVANGRNVAHLVDHFPRINKCVLFYLIRELSLFHFFCEFLLYTKSEFIVHFLDSELLISLKPMEKFHRLEVLPQIVSSLYHHCWLTGFEPETEKEKLEEKEDNFEKINDFLATLLLSHFEPTREKFPEFKKQLEFDTFLGHFMRNFLQTVIQCLETFLGKKIPSPVNESLLQVFQIDEEKRSFGKFSPDGTTKTFLESLNALLLNRLQTVLMTVSCNTFMNWVEVDYSKTMTLQRAVGELAHELSLVLVQNEGFNHEIQSMIKVISVKPRNSLEMAKEANIPEIIAHIEDETVKDRQVWMREFMERGELVMDNEECLEVLAENFKVIQVKDLKILTDFLKENVGGELSFVDQLVDIILNVLANSEEPLEVEDFLDKEEPFQLFLDFDFCPEKYFQSLTEFLNKVVDSEEDQRMSISSASPFVKSLAIDPKRAILEVQKICISDKNQVSVGVKILGILKSFTSRFLEEIVGQLIESRGEEPGKGFESYVQELFVKDFLEKEEFLKLNLFPEILKRSQEPEEALNTLSLLRIFKGVLNSGTVDLPMDLRAPFIVGLGQVADFHRWDLMSYSNTAEEIVHLSTEAIQWIGENPEGVPLEGKHKTFVQLKSQGLKEMNRYYVEKIFAEDHQLDFVQYLHSSPFQSDKNRRDFLCKSFARATLKEKELLAESEELQPHFVEMMLNITKAVGGHEKLMNGFMSCFSGFLKIFKEKLMEKVSLESLSEFFVLVLNLPNGIYIDHSFIINGIVDFIVEKAEEEKHKLQEKIKNYPESPAKVNLLERLQKENL